MPWFVSYLLIGLVWMFVRFVVALLFVTLAPETRGQIKIAASGYVVAMLTWPIDIPYVVVGVAWVLIKFWSAYRTAKKLDRVA